LRREIFGVRVDVFSIGFGPRLFGWKRGATDLSGERAAAGRLCAHGGQDPSEIDSDAAPRFHGKEKDEKADASAPQEQGLVKGASDE